MSDFIVLLWPSPREQSILIWLLVGAVFFLRDKNIRGSFVNLLSAFFNPKLQIMIWLSISWTIMSCYALWYYGFWNKTLLKETIAWAVVSGITLTFKAVSRERINFFEVLLDNIKISALLAFFVNIYSFDLWIELIIFPIMAVIVLMDVSAQVKDDLKDIRRLTSTLVAFSGLLYFSFSTWLFIDKITPDKFFAESLKVVLPITLYVVSIPFLYFWSIFAMYENLFIVFVGKPSLAASAKWKIFKTCHINPFTLKSLVNNRMFRARIINSDSIEEVEASIKLALEGKLESKS